MAKRSTPAKATPAKKGRFQTPTPTSELDSAIETASSSNLPFKNPTWSQDKGLQKRRKWKNWKQIIDLTVAAYPNDNCKEIIWLISF